MMTQTLRKGTDMAHCTDAFSSGWTYMIRILFQPFRLSFWLKCTFLLFIMGSYNWFAPEPFWQDALEQGTPEAVLAMLSEQLPKILLYIVLVMLLGILFGFISSCCRLIFLDGIYQGEQRYGLAFQRNLSNIISYFLWNIIVTFLGMIAALLIAAIVVLPFAFLEGAGAGGIGIALMVLFMLLLGLIFVVIIVAYITLLDGMVLPQMLVEDKGIIESWGRALSLALENMFDFIGYAMIRFGLGLIVFFIMMVYIFFMSLFSFAIFGMSFDPESIQQATQSMNSSIFMAPFNFIIMFLLLPVSALSDSYALSFMGKLTGNDSYRKTPGASLTGPTSDDAPESPTADSPPPASPYSSTMPVSTSGPVKFSDIPEDAPTAQPGQSPETPTASNEDSASESEPPSGPPQTPPADNEEEDREPRT